MDNNLFTGDEEQSLPFEFRAKPVSEERRLENWDAILDGIGRSVLSVHRRRKLFLSMAALIVLIAGATWYFNSNETMPLVTEYKTGYGQVKILLLPDSSKLVLNANSSVKIPQQWEEQGDRQVWLEGEGYFEVAKKVITSQKFIVHTSQVDVEVLGTKFNVNTRRSQSLVALEEGKVLLSVKGKSVFVIEKLTRPSIVLKPGEVARIDSALDVNVTGEKNIEHYSGWVKNEYHFDDTSLGAVTLMIQDIYGYKTIVTDSALLSRSISGDLRATNVEEFISVLQATLNLHIDIDANVKTITISQP